MRHLRVSVLEIVLSAAALSLGTACVPAEPEAPADPYQTPVTVGLQGVTAGRVGTAILIQNMSPERLENVEIIINPNQAGGDFRFRTSALEPNTTNTFVGTVFLNDADLSFANSGVEPSSFAVYADTPRGRGSWSGQYGPAGN